MHRKPVMMPNIGGDSRQGDAHWLDLGRVKDRSGDIQRFTKASRLASTPPRPRTGEQAARSRLRSLETLNGATGMSDMAGKAARQL